MKDYIGSAREDLQLLTEKARTIFRSAGFREIETPVLEDAALFDRSLGEGSDIVSKEMYTVEQAEDRHIAMRPENTAGVARAVIQNKLLSRHNQLKLFYDGSMFRHERPQSGRLRQFHQVGVEVFGREDALIDAETIQLAEEFLLSVDVGKPTLKLNSIGCPKCRPNFVEDLKASVEPYLDELCEDCNRRYETNPLRLLDCKNEECREIYEEEAPSILTMLCEECDEHFDAVKDYLESFGVDYELDPFLVRGLDYYRRTTFEFVAGELGSQDAVLAGGRYDGLVEELGGEHCPAVGFAAGLERLMILRDTYETLEVDTRTDCYTITFDRESLDAVLPVVSRLRKRELSTENRRVRVEIGNPEASVKSQFRRADRYGARVVLLMGSDERENGIVNVKRMDTGEQEAVGFDSTDETVNEIMNRIESVDVNKLDVEE
jgi:histidyl-tRNA synthetase